MFRVSSTIFSSVISVRVGLITISFLLVKGLILKENTLSMIFNN